MATFDNVSAQRLSMVVTSKVVPLFYQLLGHGFCVNVQTGSSVKELLCNQLGIHEDYLDQRIKSIFLNGKVVDDADTAIVDRDATIALSGAMPGLVGAILRSGGFYAPMRSQISHEKNKPPSRHKRGTITLKLLNLVVRELGPTFLQQGVLIQKNEIRSFIERHKEALMTECLGVELQDTPVAVASLQKADWETDLVLLSVKSEPAA
jgi:hypothetical protein